MVDTYGECQLGEKLRELVSDFGASGAEVSTKRKIMLFFVISDYGMARK